MAPNHWLTGASRFETAWWETFEDDPTTLSQIFEHRSPIGTSPHMPEVHRWESLQKLAQFRCSHYITLLLNSTLYCCLAGCISVSCPSVPQYCDTMNLQCSFVVRIVRLNKAYGTCSVAAAHRLLHMSSIDIMRLLYKPTSQDSAYLLPSHNLCTELRSARRRIAVRKTASKRATAGMYRNLIIRNGNGYLLATKCGNARRNILTWP